jgi:hypothetical protein
VAGVLKHALTGRCAGLPAARILALERRLSGGERSQDRFGHVVPAFLAVRIETRNVEECWGVLDDDSPDVRRLRNATTRLVLLDVELEALELRHTLEQPRGTVFATTALLGALESLTAALPETIHTFHSSRIPKAGRNAQDLATAVRPEREADSSLSGAE